MQSGTVDTVIKDVDFYRCMHDIVGCGCKLGSQIIGSLFTLTVPSCKCILKFSVAFILLPFCEVFGHPHDFTNRVMLMTVFYICHLCVGSCA